MTQHRQQAQHYSSSPLRLRSSDGKDSSARSSDRPAGNKGNSSIPPHLRLDNKDSTDSSSEMKVPIPEKKNPLLIKLRVDKERRTDQRGAPPASAPVPTPSPSPSSTPHMENTVEDNKTKKWPQNVIIIEDDDEVTRDSDDDDEVTMDSEDDDYDVTMDSEADESSDEEIVSRTPLTRSRVQPPRGSAAPTPSPAPHMENTVEDNKAKNLPQNVIIIEDDDEVTMDSEDDDYEVPIDSEADESSDEEIVSKIPLTRSRVQPPRGSAAPARSSVARMENTTESKKAVKRPQNEIIIENDDKVTEDSETDESSHNEIVLKTPLTRSRVQPPWGSGASKATLQEVASSDESKTKRTTKQRFSVTLTKKEIEEDFINLTGAKPRKRPKKRPSGVQKELDNLFPGSYLRSVTSSSYRVRKPN